MFSRLVKVQVFPSGVFIRFPNRSLPSNEPNLVNSVRRRGVGVASYDEGVGDVQLGGIQHFCQSVDLCHERGLVCSTGERPGTRKAPQSTDSHTDVEQRGYMHICH